jgi:hypothetical protein
MTYVLTGSRFSIGFKAASTRSLSVQMGACSKDEAEDRVLLMWNEHLSCAPHRFEFGCASVYLTCSNSSDNLFSLVLSLHLFVAILCYTTAIRY